METKTEEEKRLIYFLFLGDETVVAALNAIKDECSDGRKSVPAYCKGGPALAVKLSQEERKNISSLGFNLKAIDPEKDDPQGLFSWVFREKNKDT